jgi:hypothetical protein
MSSAPAMAAAAPIAMAVGALIVYGPPAQHASR